MATWTYIICNRDGTTQREVLNVKDRQITFPLNRLPTASGRIRIDNPLAFSVMDSDKLLKVYRGTTLKFCGPIISGEESADNNEQIIQFNAVGGFYYVQNRLLGKQSSAWSYGTATAVAGDPNSGPKKRSSIAMKVLNSVNSAGAATTDGGGFTGVLGGTENGVGSAPANASYGPVTFSPAGDAIVELSQAYDGFDWEVTPTEPSVVASPVQNPLYTGGPVPTQLGTFNTWYPRKGVTRNNVVLEYGANRPQVSGYKRTSSKESLLTYGYILPPGWPTSSTPGDNPLTATAAPGVLDARGRIESVIPTEQTAANLRQQLVNEHVAVRQSARQVVTFTLAQNALPSAFASYDTGDFVRARAVMNGIVRFDYMFRIWGITVNLDEAGNEQIELELAEPA